MEPLELLERQVTAVATLGEVAATVTGPRRAVWRPVYPKSLYTALRILIWRFPASLGHPAVPSQGHRGVTSLGQALATLRATPRATWADVRAVASAWRELVAAFEDSWTQLLRRATELRDECRNVATAATQAGDPQDEATRRGTAGDNVAATAQQLTVALDRDEEASAGATRDARGAAATSEAVVATSQARTASRRGHWAEVALGLLERLVAVFGEATAFPRELQRRLGDIEAALKGTNEASPNVPEALVAKVAKFEQLWEASGHLYTQHLGRALGDIHDLLLSPCGGRGGPGGPVSRVVAKWCKRAIEDIPRLLQGSDVTAVTSSGQ
ncbi:uncharacterized protein LOC120508531 [Passer montanus]|uniref:uncharacterized protein LOC120508531 n=1 Tax=Passer montanus TaxID=9160 RepID=UPI00195FACD2|nr:uncharacterized protein LOC120508531 [Passer montanus]